MKQRISCITVCWNLYRDHKSVQRKVSGVKWQQAAVVPGPGLRTDCSYWLQVFILAREIETPFLAQLSWPHPASTNTRLNYLVLALSPGKTELIRNEREKEESRGKKRGAAQRQVVWRELQSLRDSDLVSQMLLKNSAHDMKSLLVNQ